MRGIPCIGIIDGTHIRCVATNIAWINRKGWSSILVIAIVGPKQEFLYVSVGNAGSCNDSGAFTSSTFYKEFFPNYIEGIGDFLIGDSIFPLRPGLIVPYPQNTTHLKERSFNRALSAQRIIVEQAFGKLFARFPFLYHHLPLKTLQSCNNHIMSAICLHNLITYFSGNQSNLEDIGENMIHYPRLHRNTIRPTTSPLSYQQGKERREALKNSLFEQ